MYGLFGKIKTHPGKREEMIGHLLNGAGMMDDLEGCYSYIINAASDDPDGIWVFEVWRSQEDHQASLQHEAVKSIIAAARPLIAAMTDRVEFEPLGGKGLPQIPE